jgi:DNA polymerase-1
MKLLVVTKFAAKGKARQALVDQLMMAGFSPKDLTFTGVLPSDFPYGAKVSRDDLKEARGRMKAIMRRYDAVLGMGNEALTATTGHSGIMKWRGKVEHVDGVVAMSTIAPAAVARNPSQALNFQADLEFLYRELTEGHSNNHDPEPYVVVHTREKLRQMLECIKDAEAIAFDLETKSFDELEPDAFIVSLAVTTYRVDEQSSADELDAPTACFAVPLMHSHSPWRSQWEKVLAKIVAAMRQVPVRIAHNAKFDCRWLVEFSDGVPCNFDTMLAAHLLNENRSKGLKPLARILLGAPEWDIEIKGGKNAPPWYTQHKLSEILWYNAIDTWHTMRLYLLFAEEFEKQPRLKKVFDKVMMPASQSLVHIERRGVYVDKGALTKGAGEVKTELARIDAELMEYLPREGLPHQVNFNPSTFLKWFLYEHLELPILQRTESGEPSTAEGVLSRMADDHPAIPLLLERVKWNKFNSSFFNPYVELLTDESRLHTTFKLHGTVTGRLSSGKGDADKLPGAKAAKMRGVNLQQVPRDKLVRTLFGAAPGWTFIEADYSQVELRIAAFIAGEQNMLMLYATGQDIHMTMAMRMTGKPAAQVTAEERKKAKAVNFGFLYGMGWKTFIETAWNTYGVVVSEEEAKAFRRAFFEEFPMLQKWHGRQRRLAHQYKRVETPMGRVRHLPDIDSPDPGVVAEAERQSINSPVQGFASDMCVLSMVLLDRKFRKLGLRAAPIGTVHDAINFEIPNEELEIVIPIIKETMENPPLEQLFGMSLTVPIVADVCVGKRWGAKNEVSPELIKDPDALRLWLKEIGVMDE